MKRNRRKLTLQGRLIKNRLWEVGMTQKELAEQLEISPTYLGDILKGRRSGSKHMERIYNILKIEAEELKQAAGG